MNQANPETSQTLDSGSETVTPPSTVSGAAKESVPGSPVTEVPTNTTLKPTKDKKILYFVIVVALLLILAGGIYVTMRMNIEDTEGNIIPTEIVLPTSTTIPDVNVTSTPDVVNPTAAKAKYTRSQFSFTYPTSWELTEGKPDNNFLIQRAVFDYAVVLENEEFYLLIGINSTSESENGGIFLDEEHYQEYLLSHEEIDIEDTKFLLDNSHTTIGTLNDPSREEGIFLFSSLAEYIPNKVTTDQGITYNGYREYIKDKNGSEYLFVKIAKTGNHGDTTPTRIQSEIREILESISW